MHSALTRPSYHKNTMQLQIAVWLAWQWHSKVTIKFRSPPAGSSKQTALLTRHLRENCTDGIREFGQLQDNPSSLDNGGPRHSVFWRAAPSSSLEILEWGDGGDAKEAKLSWCEGRTGSLSTTTTGHLEATGKARLFRWAGERSFPRKTSLCVI